MSCPFNLTHSLHVFVAGTPIPWSASDIFSGVSKSGKRYRGAKKDTRLTEWQQKIREACMKEWPYCPHIGPVWLYMCFWLAGGIDGALVIPKYKWSESQGRFGKQGGIADLTNLAKAVEDGVAGTMFLDDLQVCGQETSRVYGDQPGVVINVGFIDAADPFVGIGF